VVRLLGAEEGEGIGARRCESARQSVAIKPTRELECSGLMIGSGKGDSDNDSDSGCEASEAVKSCERTVASCRREHSMGAIRGL
jgi:hypothetical protein